MGNVSDLLVYEGSGRGWQVRKKLPDGLIVEPLPQENAIAYAIQVARAFSWLHERCDLILNQSRGQNFFEADLPKVLDEADRLWHALVGLQEKIADPALRKGFENAHSEAVAYAGEVAPS